MGAVCGKCPIPVSAVKGSFYLSNGMYCVYGITNEGVCVDVYTDNVRKKLVSMQHGIQYYNSEPDAKTLQMLMESMIYEF